MRNKIVELTFSLINIFGNGSIIQSGAQSISIVKNLFYSSYSHLK